MRMIDADRLKAEIMGWCVVTDDLVGMGKRHEREIVLQAIEESPAIDAAPVVRGEWVVDECDTTDDVPSFSWIDFHCSECDTDYGLQEGQYGWCRYEKIPYQYCPNCGAKMEDKP